MVLIKPRLVLQIPKLIALASVALRVQWRECDEHLDDCSTDLMAVGGVLHLDILSLPAPANKGNGWTLRPVTHDSQIIHRFAFAAVLLPFCFLSAQKGYHSLTAHCCAGLVAVPGVLHLGNFSFHEFIGSDCTRQHSTPEQMTHQHISNETYYTSASTIALLAGCCLQWLSNGHTKAKAVQSLVSRDRLYSCRWAQSVLSRLPTCSAQCREDTISHIDSVTINTICV